MVFTIPNVSQATFPRQAAVHQLDFDLLAAGQGGRGVRSGCAVSAQGTPDLTVAVASGTIRDGATETAVTAGNVDLTALVDASNPRFVLVHADTTTGTLGRTAGTAAATPVAPNLPAGVVGLALVYLEAADTAIASNQLVDKRVIIEALGGGSLADPTTTKGDLLARTSSALDRLAIGANDQVLTADSTQPTGMRWADAGAGGGRVTLLSEQILASATNPLSFAAIPGTYDALRLEIVGRSDKASSDFDDIFWRANGDSGANYDAMRWITRSALTTQLLADSGSSAPLIGWMTAATSPAGAPGMAILDLPNYASSTFWKPYRATGLIRQASSYQAVDGRGWWKSTAPITSLTVSCTTGQFAVGTAARLYGIG